jgi:hypothetical protein
MAAPRAVSCSSEAALPTAKLGDPDQLEARSQYDCATARLEVAGSGSDAH